MRGHIVGEGDSNFSVKSLFLVIPVTLGLIAAYIKDIFNESISNPIYLSVQIGGLTSNPNVIIWIRMNTLLFLIYKLKYILLKN